MMTLIHLMKNCWTKHIPSLHVRRLRTTAIENFKILNNMSPPVYSNLVRLRENSTYNFRYTNILQVPIVRTSTYGKKSLTQISLMDFPILMHWVSPFVI